MRLWLAGWARGYAFLRRSLHLRGMVMHFGYAEHAGMRELLVIEYVPERGRKIGINNFVLLFKGEYRVWRLRVKSVRRYATLSDVLKYEKGQV